MYEEGLSQFERKGKNKYQLPANIGKLFYWLFKQSCHFAINKLKESLIGLCKRIQFM